MPPYGGVRKGSLISNTPSLANSVGNERRTTSGRAVRANTTRPANYYARPFANIVAEDTEEITPPLGFFPAVTFFSDAIAALPREVVRQVTLVKEVEAKIHGPAAQLGAMCDELMRLPVPSKTAGQLQSALLLSFTAPNSNAGSANASLINGVAPNASRYGQDSAAGSVADEEAAHETEEGLKRRKKYAELTTLAHSMLPNLDEKNVVLTEAIRVMNAQLMRIDGVMPYVENEIPEEARLGSMTHWAYSDNRLKTKAAAQSRRDVVTTNSLAAAAHAVHESDIAQTRRDAMKEARGLGKPKNKEPVDSEFEDKPRKTAKGVKGKTAAPTGLGITNGEPAKRRKVEKAANAAPIAMERQASSMSKVKSQKETPRATPVDDLTKRAKPTKPAPIPQAKRRGLNSAQASPALASSPLQVQVPQTMEPPGARPQSARLRQNSSASNLRHEQLADEHSRPSSATGPSTSASRVPSRKRTRDELEIDTHVESIEKDGSVLSPGKTLEDSRPQPSRSNSSNKTPSGGASKVGTPRSEAFNNSTDAPMARVRSTRSGRGNNKEESSEAQPKGHKRNGGVGSMSGLMKQIAPFNRSPDLDRRRSKDDGDDEDDIDDTSEDDADDNAPGPRRHRSGSVRQRKPDQPSRSISRHGSGLQDDMVGQEMGPDEQLRAEDEAEPDHETVGDEDMPDIAEPPALIPDADDDPDTPSPSLTPVRASYDEPEGQVEYPEDEVSEPEPVNEVPGEVEEVDDDGEEPDPDDPDEPKYCYCLRGSYGDMVGCDNAENCPREWFHLGCTGLKRMPTEEESWFCDYCRPVVASRRRGVARGRGRG